MMIRLPIVEFKEGGEVVDFRGSYEEYIESQGKAYQESSPKESRLGIKPKESKPIPKARNRRILQGSNQLQVPDSPLRHA